MPIQGGFLLDVMLPIKQFEGGKLTDMPKSKYGLSNAFKVTVTSQQRVAESNLCQHLI